MRLVRMSLLCAGLAWSLLASINAVRAQSWDNIQIDQLKQAQAQQNTQIQVDDQKLKSLQRWADEQDAQKINERVIKLETIAETNRDLLIGIALSLVGLMIEALYRFMGSLKRSRQEDEMHG